MTLLIRSLTGCPYQICKTSHMRSSATEVSATVQVTSMTSFNSSSFPDSLAIVKEGSMTIGAHACAWRGWSGHSIKRAMNVTGICRQGSSALLSA